jgi:hypothetical protein
MKTIGAALAVGALLAGCANKSEDVSPSYVSPVLYQNYECDALILERERLTAKVNELSRVQDDKAQNDAVATGVGVVLFWPALFFLASGSDREAELSSLKGNYDAVQQTLIQKQCLSPAQIEAERMAAEEARIKAEEAEAARLASAAKAKAD